MDEPEATISALMGGVRGNRVTAIQDLVREVLPCCSPVVSIHVLSQVSLNPMKEPWNGALASLADGSPATEDEKRHAPPYRVRAPASRESLKPRVSDSSTMDRSALS
jgi:hypothetical protein